MDFTQVIQGVEIRENRLPFLVKLTETLQTVQTPQLHTLLAQLQRETVPDRIAIALVKEVLDERTMADYQLAM